MKVDKPWGNFKLYALNRNCTVKIITIKPNQETSLHWHNLRSDTWVILDNGLNVQIGDEIHKTEAGEEFFIPPGQLHRIISTGKKGRVLEIAFGYSAEDDISRLADDYGREMDI
ncbi:MAG: phosphomannose isomerase type II C-terminal cupin domain [Candidatus Subteraquimicrobiales bacterium]|nr:phosphomannose isomerase type II C-terminal cupin domain [Candidatus Subteraquimicrobiales bacterium]